MQTNSGAIFSKKKYLISKRKRSAYANTICTSLAYRSKICDQENIPSELQGDEDRGVV